MVGKVRKLEPVLRGEAVLIHKRRLRTDLIEDYTRTHQRVGASILIPKAPNERVSVKRGLPQIERLLGETKRGRIFERRIPLPVGIHNLEEFIGDLRSRPDKWARERGPYPPWAFGFSMYGNRSSLFADPEQLAEWLERYLEIDENPNDRWENFILYAVDTEAGPWNVATRAKSKASRDRARHKRNIPEFRRLLNADRQRERRAKMSETKLEEIRRKDKERRAAKRQSVTYRNTERSRDRIAHAEVRRLLGMKEVPARGRRKPK